MKKQNHLNKDMNNNKKQKNNALKMQQNNQATEANLEQSNNQSFK